VLTNVSIVKILICSIREELIKSYFSTSLSDRTNTSQIPYEGREKHFFEKFGNKISFHTDFFRTFILFRLKIMYKNFFYLNYQTISSAYDSTWPSNRPSHGQESPAACWHRPAGLRWFVYC
jgi:hypothetical protein